ncbi:hypothetical protein K505DRAFT_362121 [Melanomma pulvis-pyrius CBS 109.77]|uniref:Uncharacterized protein n=1 Tax=Melanomma pulvis-pyrius CBS 109.77 TaxID=1314802 RepID=A0A6A6XA28_9PLEO|nr:hypothetical protein K505DRAFT_362121 [Melanomma pulvis-pyrius CBS 109.77]
MARIAPFHAKRPRRASLRRIGIPDGRDLLAVYFWWVRQRYYRASAEMAPRDDEDSVRSTLGDWEPLSPLPPPVKPEARFSMLDFEGVGGQFD